MVSKHDSYLQHLAQVPLFAHCTVKDLQKIAKVSTEMNFPAGTVLVEQGQAGREAFIIVSGQATVTRNGQKVATLGPGDVIGQYSLFDHGPRTATVTADNEVDVLVLSSAEFRGCVDEVPAVAHALMAAMATKIREFDREHFG